MKFWLASQLIFWTRISKLALYAFVTITITFLNTGLAYAFDERTDQLRQWQVDFYIPGDETCSSVVSGGGGPAPANREEFVLRYAESAFAIGKANGIPYDAMLAQAAVESGNGGSGLTTEANNFFGIKAGSSWTGPVWTGQTREEYSSGSVTITDSFRAYATPEDGWQGYADFIRANSRYRNALNYPNDPFQYIVELKNAGYATDSKYIATNHAVIRQVQQIIATKTDLPPSSEVTPDVPPPSGSTTGPPAVQNSGSSCPFGGIGTGAGSIDNFPLGTTKAQLQQGAEGAFWCYQATSNCHHDYNAADIHVAVGTPVVAVKSGTVVLARSRSGGGGDSVVIRDTSAGGGTKYIYYYTHMSYQSINVTEGQNVAAGQPIGTVGPRSQAMGTAPHLHFDMLPQPQYTNRPGCSSAECSGLPFVDVQPFLAEIYKTLP